MAQSGHGADSQSFVLLDGLRGIGAILVIIGHTWTYWDGSGSYYSATGAMIVDLFFLLSGFVIAYAYEPRFAKGMKSAEFILHRIVRLYPLYLLGLTLGILVRLTALVGDADPGTTLGEIAYQAIPGLFMMPSPELAISHDVYPFNAPAWTLFFEFSVNILYVLIWRFLSTCVLMGIVAISGVCLAFTIFHFGTIDSGADWTSFWGGFARASFGFFAGVLTFRMVGSPTRAPSRVSKWAFVVLFAIPAICFIPASREMQPYLDFLIVGVFGIPLLLISQSMRPPKSFTKLFLFGGRISYALYILHYPFRDAVMRLDWRFPDLHPAAAPWTGIILMALVIVLSYYAEKYFDRPARRAFVGWYNARMSKKRADVAAVSMTVGVRNQ